MIQKIKQLITIHQDNRGMTLLELCVCVGIVGVLASVAMKSYHTSKARVLDAAAHTEARELGKTVMNVFLDKGDTDLQHNPEDGVRIGAKDNSGNDRKPVFVLSDGMEALITGNSNWDGGGNGYCEAFISHPNGTKEFYLLIDEVGGETLFPTSAM